MSEVPTFAVKGGVGDFLQSLPFMLAHPNYRYLVASHQNYVTEFFAATGIAVEELSLGRLTGIEVCPRQFFFEGNPFRKQPRVFSGNRPVLGIHLGGSNYSISIEKRFGFPSKALPAAVLYAILLADKRHDIMVFGLASEFDKLVPEWRERDSEHLRFIADDDITASLSRVTECYAFIGSDSAFKTMSAMLRIKTIVWVGNYRDDTRDRIFLEPYMNEGVMDVVRYWDLDEYEIGRGVAYCRTALSGQEETADAVCTAEG